MKQGHFSQVFILYRLVSGKLYIMTFLSCNYFFVYPFEVLVTCKIINYYKDEHAKFLNRFAKAHCFFSLIYSREILRKPTELIFAGKKNFFYRE